MQTNVCLRASVPSLKTNWMKTGRGPASNYPDW